MTKIEKMVKKRVEDLIKEKEKESGIDILASKIINFLEHVKIINKFSKKELKEKLIKFLCTDTRDYSPKPIFSEIEYIDQEEETDFIKHINQEELKEFNTDIQDAWKIVKFGEGYAFKNMFDKKELLNIYRIIDEIDHWEDEYKKSKHKHLLIFINKLKKLKDSLSGENND